MDEKNPKFRLWVIGPAKKPTDEEKEFYWVLGDTIARAFPNQSEFEIVLGATGGGPVAIAEAIRVYGNHVTAVYPFNSDKELDEFRKTNPDCLTHLNCDQLILYGEQNPANSSWDLKIRFVARDAMGLYELTKDGVPGAVLIDGMGDAGTCREIFDAWKLELPYFFYNMEGKAGRLFEEAMRILGMPKGEVYRCGTIEDIIFNLKAHFGLLDPSESPPKTPAAETSPGEKPEDLAESSDLKEGWLGCTSVEDETPADQPAQTELREIMEKAEKLVEGLMKIPSE